MEGKEYFLIGECKEELNELKGKQAAGIPTEFKSFGDNITYKPGYHCVIASSPASGKSFFALHTLLHLADKNDHKSFIYSPELGSKSEIIALLVHMKSGKTVYDIKDVEVIQEEELLRCLKWLNNHFVIYEPMNTPAVEDLYEAMELCQQEYNIVFNNILIDNLNDCKEPIGSDGRQDLGVENLLSFVHKKNKKLNCYTFMVTHSSSQGQPITQDGIRYYPPITPREIRSGQAIFRKAFLLLTIWRPPHGLVGEDGTPYTENESHIIVLKAKPAHTATKGFVGKIYYDWKKAKFTDNPPTIRKF